MKEKIIIIGASELQNPLILKAKEKGYETHVFAWAAGDIGEKTADKFYPISIIEKERILEEAKKINPVGVISIASDLANITVNHIAENLNLIGNSQYSTEVSTNKYKMREALYKSKLNVPKYFLLEKEEDIHNISLQYPLIVKPTDRSGSRGVQKVYNITDLKNTINSSINQSFEKKAIIEEFIEGKEYSVEFISYKGKHYFLAITEKITTGEPNYIEIGHIQPANISEDLKQEIISSINAALTALDIKFGASHSEIIICQNNNIKIVEIGSRMGGDCIGSDLVEISTGFDYVSMCIDIACNKELIMEKGSENSYAFVKYLFDYKDFEELEFIKKNYPEVIWRISNIDGFDNRIISDSSLRYGFYILKCDSLNQGLRLITYNK